MATEAQPELPATQKAKRRCLQFSTRALLIVVTVAGVMLGGIGRYAEMQGRRTGRQRRAVSAIEAIGGRVKYSAEFGCDAPFVRSPNEWPPRDWLDDVDGVILSGRHVTDAALVQVQELPELEIVILNGTATTHAGIARLTKALPNCRIANNP